MFFDELVPLIQANTFGPRLCYRCSLSHNPTGRALDSRRQINIAGNGLVRITLCVKNGGQ